MAKQIHKRFSSAEVKEILGRYLRKEVELAQARALLKIGRRRFFDFLSMYRKDPDKFEVSYRRKAVNRKLGDGVNQKIIRELKKEAKLIDDKGNPIRDFNYSFIKEVLAEKHQVQVSLPTIIDRAKKMGITKRGRSTNAMTGKS